MLSTMLPAFVDAVATMNCADTNIKWRWHGEPPAFLSGFRAAARKAWQVRFGAQCPVCSRSMVFYPVVAGPGLDRMATLDHKLARGLGGGNELTNLWFICRKCNHAKSKVESVEAQRQRDVYRNAETYDSAEAMRRIGFGSKSPTSSRTE